MSALRELLELLRATEPELGPLRSSPERTGARDLPSELRCSSVMLRDLTDVQHIVRVIETTVRGESRYDRFVDLRIWSSVDGDHGCLEVPVHLAYEVLKDPSNVNQGGFREELKRSGLLGVALLAAFTSDADLVDAAADHECAVVRIAAASNRLPTQRSYRLASDPCRDVALAALENRSAQEHMTYQFRDALDVADGFPLSRCACGLA